jgi:hypothetical protein
MLVTEASRFVGQFVVLTTSTPAGGTEERVAEVFEVGFVPLLGPCFVTDLGDVRLDRVVSAHPFVGARKIA